MYHSVGIIGGTGGMGRWLANILQKEGCTVHVSGRNTQMKSADVAGICEMVVISVPIAATAEVIAQVGPLLKKEQVLMDLTSLKKEPVAAMLACSISEVVGCHPLFGPSISRAQGNNIVLCQGRGQDGYRWIKQIFEKENYTVLERTPEEHDRMMSVVQALNHLNSLALGMAIAATGIPLAEVGKFSTPNFSSKMSIVKKVMTESPEMFADIIAGNPDADKILETYLDVVRNMQRLITTRDIAALKNAMMDAAKKLYPTVPLSF